VSHNSADAFTNCGDKEVTAIISVFFQFIEFLFDLVALYERRLFLMKNARMDAQNRGRGGEGENEEQGINENWEGVCFYILPKHSLSERGSIGTRSHIVIFVLIRPLLT